MGRYKDKKDRRHRDRSSSRENIKRERESYKKKKKKRERSRDSSRSSSRSSLDSSGSGRRSRRNDEKSAKDRSRLQKEKERIKAEKKMQKELMKAIETPEEKRQRRIAKKEEKERKRREKMGWDKEYMGYTNTDNPFGDSKLLDTFVWHKKLDHEGLKNLSVIEKKKIMHRKQDTNKAELAKVKEQRHVRERERQQRDEEMELIQREKEADNFKAWEEQEDKFHLEQAKLRSRIRIKDGRAKPIDLLAKYASSAEDMDDLSGIEMQEPYTYLNGLTMFDLEDLLADIKVYMELEQSKNADFWRDMTVITEEELQKLKRIAAEEQEQGTSGVRGARREGVNKAVADDVANIFHSKTYSQLLALQKTMTERIKTGGSSLDVGYWESLLSQLKAYMARARLRDSHQELLKSKLYKLKLEQLGADAVEGGNTLFPIKQEEQPETSQVNPEEDAEDEEEVQDTEETMTEEDWENKCMEDYEAGSFSPSLMVIDELPADTVIIDAAEAALTLEGRRKLLKKTGDASTGTEDAFVRHVKEGMDNAADEDQAGATFAVEAQISQQVYLWADKYRPRKPRFFNRVHTGFEWNKYNQTHYDFDNPPPKIVQGYKFNIFYPDLIDKTQAPSYTITPTGDKDFSILRFSAGAPYEDIAFKIVNREWEYSHKHGFRCQFMNSIFQLWFHFKRYRYRR